MKKIAKRKKPSTKKRGKRAEEKVKLAKERVKFAGALELVLLRVGRMDTTVYTTGNGNSTLHIKYVLMGRVLSDRLVNETIGVDKLTAMGFTKVVCEDGRDETYTFTLK